MTWSPEVMEHLAPFAGRSVSEDRVRGMLLGLAIGDSLGNTTEGCLPGIRYDSHGEIRDYLPNWNANGLSVGLPSDDTQLAFWMIEHLIEIGRIEPEDLARLFTSRRIFGIGKATREFIEAFKSGEKWLDAAQRSAGNGALTRIPAVLLPHIAKPSADLWVDVVFGTAVTHNDPAAIGASVALAAILAELLTADHEPTPEWWVDTFVRFARLIEGEGNSLEPRDGPLKGKWQGPLWRFVEEHVPRTKRGAIVDECGIWYSGAYLLETVPSALYILMCCAGNLEEAIVRAVNDTKDNDSIAAIVGAAVGALHGGRSLPGRWSRSLLGRTQESDDGRVFELVDQAIHKFQIA